MEPNGAAVRYAGHVADVDGDNDSVLNSSKFGRGSGEKDELLCGQQNLNETNLE